MCVCNFWWKNACHLLLLSSFFLNLKVTETNTYTVCFSLFLCVGVARERGSERESGVGGMDRRKCKLCSKSFKNGKALGGHMRTHLATLPLPAKTPQQLSGPTESTSSSSEEERENEEKVLLYGLRENPKKSLKLVDPEFMDAGSVVHDKESETESIRINPTRKRSNVTRKMGVIGEAENDQEVKKPKLIKPSSTQSISELEPVSSVSDTSLDDQDCALCLMMLSRDVWSVSVDSVELKLSPETRCKYKCETCNKVFRSSQALVGHRMSHSHEAESTQSRNFGSNVDKKVYQCPFCGKVFGSGQALGGHKRSHLLSSSTNGSKAGDDKVGQSLGAKFEDGFIDLNLPAPMEDEDIRQPEVSVVSDAEFINPIKH